MDFGVMVLSIGSFCLGAYTWWWLRSPVAHFVRQAPQSQEITAADEPEVDEGPFVEGLLMSTPCRVMARLARGEQAGNRGKTIRCVQSRTWMLSSVAHLTDSSASEGARTREIFSTTNQDMSDNDEGGRMLT